MTLLPRLALSSILASPLVACAADDPLRWIQGSWVNVRSSEAANSDIVTHLSANTQVALKGVKGSTCAIGWGADQQGFVPCRFLGEKALVYADIANPTLPSGQPNPAYSATRAFWLAPSMYVLFEAGDHFRSTLLTAQQQAAEAPSEDNRSKPPPLIRYGVPEYEAMKAVLAKGIVAPPDRDPILLSCKQMQEAKQVQLSGQSDAQRSGAYQEWHHPQQPAYPGTFPVLHDCRIPELPGVTLPAVKPSLFKSSKELLRGSAEIEQISAHFGIPEKGRATSGPKWEEQQYEFRYTGAWDIGKYALTLEKPVVEHVIGRTGLVGAYQWTPQFNGTPRFLSNCAEGFQTRRMGKQLLPGYPGVKDALLWFQAPAALPFKTAKVATRTVKVAKGAATDGVSRAVLYEVDVNGDSIADFVQWDIWGTHAVNDSGPAVVLRQVFVNINGAWYPLENDYDGECT